MAGGDKVVGTKGNIRSKDTGKKVTDDTTDTVDGKDVESLVDANEKLELGGKVGGSTTDNTEDGAGPDGDVTGSGGDGDETGDGAGAEADGGPLALQAVVEEDPRQTGQASGQVGDEEDLGRQDVGSEGRAAVEAEPADPEKDGAEHDVGDVMGPVGETVQTLVTSPLADHERVSEGGDAGVDVDGSATGEVEGAEGVKPAVGAPGPAGDGVIDDGGPYKDEYDGGKDAATVGNGTKGESRAGRVFVVSDRTRKKIQQGRKRLT